MTYKRMIAALAAIWSAWVCTAVTADETVVDGTHYVLRIQIQD